MVSMSPKKKRGEGHYSVMLGFVYCRPLFRLVSPIEYLSVMSHISNPQEYHMAQEVISAQYWVNSYSL